VVGHRVGIGADRPRQITIPSPPRSIFAELDAKFAGTGHP
jgi:hypothetical protein